jgi:LPXTG-site transpeptidase (sortase) family protein
MSRGKHSCDNEFDLENIPLKEIGMGILVIAIIIAVFFGGKTVYSTFIANGNLLKKDKTENEDNTISIEEEKMPTNLYGYNVLGKLIIDDKNYSKYILEVNKDEESDTKENASTNDVNTDNTTEIENNSTESAINSEDLANALKRGLVKLYGDDLNSKGNFCIIGHNEDEFFSVLNELKEKDEFEIEDSSNTKNKYIVTEIYTIEPTDLECLMPNDKYQQVTLITCKSGSNQRLVVKALEENDYNLSINETKDSNITEDSSVQDESNENNSVE